MVKLLSPFKVILLALKPLSKTADIWDLRDIANLAINTAGFGGGWVMLSNFEWFSPYYLLIFPAILLFIAALKLQRKVDKYERQPRPHLEPCDSPYTDRREIRSIDGKQLIGKPLFCHIIFRNKPNIRRPEANAPKVRTVMTFYDVAGKRKFQLDKVRPAGIAQPPHQQPSELPQKYYEVEYNANGNPWEITVALKYEEDDECYAFDDHCYRYYSTKWRKPEYLLQGDSFYIKVDLSGENTEGTWWFELKNHGVGKGIEAKATSQPTFGKVD